MTPLSSRLPAHTKLFSNACRRLHYLGSGLALTALAGAALTKKPALLLAVPIAGECHSYSALS